METIAHRQTSQRVRCCRCNVLSAAIEHYNAAPCMIFVEYPAGQSRSYAITRSIKTLIGNDQRCNLLLRGVVYWIQGIHENHFVCRIITKEREVWFNDGISTGRNSRYEGKLNDFPANYLSMYQGSTASCMIYAR